MRHQPMLVHDRLSISSTYAHCIKAKSEVLSDETFASSKTLNPGMFREKTNLWTQDTPRMNERENLIIYINIYHDEHDSQ